MIYQSRRSILPVYRLIKWHLAGQVAPDSLAVSLNVNHDAYTSRRFQELAKNEG